VVTGKVVPAELLVETDNVAREIAQRIALGATTDIASGSSRHVSTVHSGHATGHGESAQLAYHKLVVLEELFVRAAVAEVTLAAAVMV
jgi:hypothetical protein